MCSQLSTAGAHARETADALPSGTRLAEFEIRDVVGMGGFGIVYRAWDAALEREVALKEYMPAALAGRGRDDRVSLRSAMHAESFALGLRSFVNEAKLLAQFEHPSLVKVYRFWEERGTAYIAMPFYRGRTLPQMRQAMLVPPDEAVCRRLLDPLLSALQVLHAAGVFHRDIAPDNLIVDADGVPVLLDFGAARRVLGSTQSLTAILKPNFAPLEQYADTPSLRQGPWTDLYALGATVYYLITGAAPLPAAARALHDELVPLSTLAPPGYSPAFLAAIDWTLALRPQDRPQDVAALRAALGDSHPAALRTEHATTIAWTMATNPATNPAEQAYAPTRLMAPPRQRARWSRLLAPLGGVALLGGALAWAVAPADAPPAAAASMAAHETAPPTRQFPQPAPRMAAAESRTATAEPRPPAAGPRTPPPERVALAATTATDGPRERCGDRRFISLLMCMKRECAQPALRSHPECRRMEAMEAEARQRYEP